MSKATFGQALQALNLIHAKDPTAERLTALYNSGILADVLDADLSKVERDAVRAALKLGSIFTRNEHGHVVVTFTGLDITGAEEIARLEAGGYRVGNYAKQCFTSTNDDSYDKCHRLVAGQQYRIALVPGKDIERDSERTTAALQKLGEKCGYGKALGGHIPRIREIISDKQMEEMGIWYIAALHDPIKNSGGNPDVLSVHRCGGERWVSAFWGYPDSQWSDDGAFAFPVAAS